MNLPDIFHFYFIGFIGVVILFWSWEGLRIFFEKSKKESRGQCPVCKMPWRGEVNVFQKRCEKCGFRLKFRHLPKNIS